MGTDQPTPKRRWRPRFSLLTLVLGVLFVSACGGLWYRWEPWACEAVIACPGLGCSEIGFVPSGDLFFVRQAQGSESYVYRDAFHFFDTRTFRLWFTIPMATSNSTWSCLPGWSPDGRYMVSFDESRFVLYDLSNGHPAALERTSGGYVPCYGFADNVRLFVYLTDGDCNERELRVRDMETGRERRAFERPVYWFQPVPDQPWALCTIEQGKDLITVACDLRTGAVLPPGLPGGLVIAETECAAQAKMLVVSGEQADGESLLYVWRPEDKAPRILQLGRQGVLPYFDVSPDGRCLRVQMGSLSGADTLLLNPMTGEQFGLLPREWGVHRFLPRGRALLYRLVEQGPSGLRYQFAVWDVAAQAEVSRLEQLEYPPSGEGNLRAAADGRRLLLLDSPKAWDLDSGRLLFNLQDTTGTVSCSADGSRLLAALIEKECFGILDAWSGVLLQRLQTGDSAAAFSPDGNHLLARRGQKVQIWSRRRPEYWWGIAWLPEFWIALLSGGALLVIAARRLRARKAVKQEAA
jgi:WD40 repeat protein